MNVQAMYKAIKGILDRVDEAALALLAHRKSLTVAEIPPDVCVELDGVAI